MGASREAWLDAIGIDRWVRRDSPSMSASSAGAPAPVLTVCSGPLSAAEQAVLEKMLAAISVPLSACAVHLGETIGFELPTDARPLLLLSDAEREAECRSIASAYAGPIAVVAHPSRFASQPDLKRPAWEALKHLSDAMRSE